MEHNLRRKQDSVLKRISIRFLKLLLFVGLPLVLFGFTFRLKELTVEGSTRNTPEQIKEHIIQTKLDSNALLLYLKYRLFAEVRIPFVEKIDLELTDNNSVHIRVYEKRVTGCVEFMGDYLYFDKDGFVVESASKRLEDIPQIKGLKFDKIILNEKLEVQKEELFDIILAMTRLNEKYELKIDTISFNQKLEVTVQSDGVKAMLGKRKAYDDILSELKSILAEAEGMDIELDLRNFDKGKGTITAIPEKTTE